MWGALALAGLFTVQVGLTLNFLGDEARTIASLTWLSWGYLALAGALLVLNARSLGHLFKVGLFAKHPAVHPGAPISPVSGSQAT